MIIECLGESVNEYAAHEPQLLSTRHVCPLCDQYCHRHGSYARRVRTEDETHIILILRVHCVFCLVTHAILPSFLPPYGRYPVEAHEDVITQQANGVPLEAVGDRFSQTVETSKRWLAAFRRKTEQVVGALRAACGRRGLYLTEGDAPPLRLLASLCDAWLGASVPPVYRARDRCFGWVNLILCQAVARVWV
jgi:hypothetical protein